MYLTGATGPAPTEGFVTRGGCSGPTGPQKSQTQLEIEESQRLAAHRHARLYGTPTHNTGASNNVVPFPPKPEPPADKEPLSNSGLEQPGKPKATDAANGGAHSMAVSIPDFFGRVLPWPDRKNPVGFCNIHWTFPDGRKGMGGRPFQKLKDFLSLIPWCNEHSKWIKDIYFCTSRQENVGTIIKGKAHALRNADNSQASKALYVDVDVKPGAYSSQAEALEALAKFRQETNFPPVSALVDSGSGGLHVYWIFNRALTIEEWHPYANGLRALLEKHGIKFDAGVTTDCARILRVPGTFNKKQQAPRLVRLLALAPEETDIDPHTLDWMKVAAEPRRPVLRTPAGQPNLILFECEPRPPITDPDYLAEIKTVDQYPPIDPRVIIKKCPVFFEALRTGGKDHDQGLWMLTGLAATFMDNGRGVFHKLSDKHADYDKANVDAMYDRKLAERENRGLGWPACKTFEQYGSKQCATCPHFALGKSPLNLTSPVAAVVHPTNANNCDRVSLDDFYAYMPMHNYIFAPSREPWPASSVDARLGKIPLFNANGTPSLDVTGKQKKIPASLWLDQNKPVEQMTWAPGLPAVIRDRLISEGGWIVRPQVSCFNLYRPPTIERGNAAEVQQWLDHAHKVFGDDAEHIVKYLAHRVQRPQEKINHAIILGGAQGIGKDTLLEPVKHAVGPWNFVEVSPQQMLGRFNGFLKSVILRMNEARDLSETNRFSFYDHMKAYTAAPPDVLRVDEKHLREHSVLNCCGVIITTNHKTDGIYLPPDDRRHFVAWSDLTKDDFVNSYWNILWGWYGCGGYRHVAAYLAELDISSFDPKAPPPKTPAFWDIVDANRAPEDAELADVLDKMKNPDAVTIADITREALGVSLNFREWITDRKHRRAIPHRLEKCGYIPVRNDAAKDGLWVINGSRQVVYVKSELSIPDRFKAASDLARRLSPSVK
jgi:hypothetical protein